MTTTPIESGGDDAFAHVHKGHRISVQTALDPSMSVWPIQVFVTHPGDSDPVRINTSDDPAGTREEAFQIGSKAGIAYVDQL